MFRNAYKNEGSRWFRRFLKDCRKISPHIRVKRIKHGFFRIYWRDAYIGECYKEMPLNGHDIDDLNMNLVSQKYYEKYEDRTELTRKIKNFVEGYWESLDKIRTRTWMVLHDKEFHKQATQGYKQMVIK